MDPTSSRQLGVKEAVADLLSGKEGAEVVEGMKKKYQTERALISAMACVRNAVIARYEPDFSELENCEEVGVRAFLAEKRGHQLDLQSAHRREKSWSPGAEEALQRLQLLPPNMSSFKARVGGGISVVAAAHELMCGAPGGDVMKRLAKTYTTTGSLISAMAAVRARVYEAHTPDISELDDFREEEGVQAFLESPLKEKVSIQRAHSYSPSWSDGAEEALSRCDLLPPSMESFKTTKREVVCYKREKEAALNLKNRSLIVVEDGAHLVDVVTRMVETTESRQPFYRIALPLLLVCGRRMTELMNGRSTFSPAEDERHTKFGGQLKVKGREVGEYQIPLLCKYSTFCIGLNALREKQNQERLEEETERSIHDMYGGNLNRAMKKGRFFGGLIPPTHNVGGREELLSVHDLRSIYSALVHKYFDCNSSPEYTRCRILGHSSMQESLNYANVRVEGCHGVEKSFGNLVLS